MKSLLASAARAHAFSTALPAPAVAAASAALLTCQNEGRSLRKRLWSHVRALDVALGGSGEGSTPGRAGRCSRATTKRARAILFGAMDDARSSTMRADDRPARVRNVVQSPIAAVVFGEESEALEASARLLRAGFHVPAIRPPTVPPGTVDFASRSPPRTTRKTSPRCAPRWDAPTRKCDTFPGLATRCGREGS